VTDSNGLASITPTVGSFGPCDVYITVTAGSAIAQIELESVDPMTMPQHRPGKGGGIRGRPIAAQFGVAAPLPLDAGAQLYAAPQEVPAADPPPSACPGVSKDDSCDAGSDSGSTGPPGTVLPGGATPSAKKEDKDFIVPRGASSAAPDIQPAPSPVESPAKKPAQTAECPDPSPNPPNSPTECAPASKSVAQALLDDRRSCRFAQTEDGTPP